MEGKEYEFVYRVHVNNSDDRIVVRFDKERGTIQRFAVQLQSSLSRYSTLESIAQFDHDPQSLGGHDIYREGLHIDVYHQDGSVTKLWPNHPPLPASEGAILRRCVDYFKKHVEYFDQVHSGRIDPSDPPNW